MMAASPAHRFGQIIGELLESAVEPMLRGLSQRHGLYLDTKGPRPARSGKKVSWKDGYGNTHDIDFVLECRGSDERIGEPVALIETAWRRYTKHSRNKAQEIQGAILPLAAAHSDCAPFLGVILAGIFTEGALAQLRSVGFRVLFFPEDCVIQAFKSVGIDAAGTETTDDADYQARVKAWEGLSRTKQHNVAQTLISSREADVRAFIAQLEAAITRQVAGVHVLPLHGVAAQCESASDAIK
jgi:hypothetical protein